MMKKILSNPQEQLKDFFSTKGGNIQLIQNPYNLLYFLKLSYSLIGDKITIDQYQEYENTIEKAIQEETYVAFRKIPLWAKEVINNDNIVSLRIEELIEQGAFLDGLELNIIRYNSLTILKKCIDLGMDMNYYKRGNYPLRVCVVENRTKLFDYLLKQSKIQIDYTDMDDMSLLNNMAKRGYLHLAKILLERYPEKIYSITEKKETSLDWLNNFFKTNELKNLKFSEENINYLKEKSLLSISYLYRQHKKELFNLTSSHNLSKELKEMWETVEFKERLEEEFSISTDNKNKFKI